MSVREQNAKTEKAMRGRAAEKRGAPRPVPYRATDYGFAWGALEVTRIASDAKKGWVVIGLDTRRAKVQVYATKTGKVRIYLDGKELR